MAPEKCVQAAYLGQLPLDVQIDLDVSVRLITKSENLLGIRVHPGDQILNRQPALAHRSEQKWQHGLQPWESRKCRVCGLLLFGVRSMVR